MAARPQTSDPVGRALEAAPPDEAALIRVGPRAELRGVTVVSGGRHGIAVFPSSSSDQVYAVDNRCPHMGFPLHRGSVDDDILTCHWHNARFDLASGGTFDLWADDVQTYPVTVRDGIVYVDPRPPPGDRRARARARLRDGLENQLNLVISKQVLALLAAGEPAAALLTIGGHFGATFRRDGWQAGLTIMTALGRVLPRLDEADQALALYHGLVQVARDCADQPPRFALTPLPAREVRPAQLTAWFRRLIDVRDSDGAERVLLTLIATGAPPATLATALAAAATDHVYLDGGHALDFVNKACELLDLIGWAEAAVILPSLVPVLSRARRAEETGAWRHPVDLPALLAPAVATLPELATVRPDAAWTAPNSLVPTLLGDNPGAIIAALTGALGAGAPPAALAQTVSYAAALRVARFHTTNEFSDWITVLHTFTNANAVHQLLRRAPSPELLRGLFHVALQLYLDRFLNIPAARLPEVRPTHRATLPTAPTAIVAALHDELDREQRVQPAAELVDQWLARELPLAPLIAALGHLLLREDAEFHTYQMLEAGLTLHEALAATDPNAAGHVLVAVARYLAAHAPTSRALGQTATIARRLQRGDDLALEAPVDEEISA